MHLIYFLDLSLNGSMEGTLFYYFNNINNFLIFFPKVLELEEEEEIILNI